MAIDSRIAELVRYVKSIRGLFKQLNKLEEGERKADKLVREVGRNQKATGTYGKS